MAALATLLMGARSASAHPTSNRVSGVQQTADQRHDHRQLDDKQLFRGCYGTCTERSLLTGVHHDYLPAQVPMRVALEGEK